MRRKTLKQLVSEKRQTYTQAQPERKPRLDPVAQPIVDQRTSILSTRSLSALETEDAAPTEPLVDYIPLPHGEAEEKYRIVLTGRQRQTAFILGFSVRGEVLVGVGGDVDLNLSAYASTDYGVSRRHALLRPSAEHLYLLDLNSTNGTQVNGVRVYPGQQHALADGDQIKLGSLLMALSIVG